MRLWKYFTLLIGSILIVHCDSLSDRDHEDRNSPLARERLPRSNEYLFGAMEFQVSLNDGSRDFCGGSILSEKYILTAAHCVYTERGPIRGPIYLVLGRRRFPRSSTASAMAKRIFVPTLFHGDKGPRQEGDIAVVELDRKLLLDWTEFTRTVQLPRPIKTNDDGSLEYDSYENKICTLFLYEEMDPILLQQYYPQRWLEELRMSRTLYIGEAEVLEQTKCELSWQSVANIGCRHLCAVMLETQYRGVCTGEPGTGLIYGKDTIIGVASFGSELCLQGRQPADQPGVFTRVSSWLWFIKAILENDTSVTGICNYPVINIPRKRNRGAVAAASCAWVVGLSVVLVWLVVVLLIDS